MAFRIRGFFSVAALETQVTLLVVRGSTKERKTSNDAHRAKDASQLGALSNTIFNRLRPTPCIKSTNISPTSALSIGRRIDPLALAVFHLPNTIYFLRISNDAVTAPPTRARVIVTAFQLRKLSPAPLSWVRC